MGCARTWHDDATATGADTLQRAVIGLGRMGANISRRLMRAGHSTVVWDANPAAWCKRLGSDGATAAKSA